MKVVTISTGGAIKPISENINVSAMSETDVALISRRMRAKYTSICVTLRWHSRPMFDSSAFKQRALVLRHKIIVEYPVSAKVATGMDVILPRVYDQRAAAAAVNNIGCTNSHRNPMLFRPYRVITSRITSA